MGAVVSLRMQRRSRPLGEVESRTDSVLGDLDSDRFVVSIYV